MSKYLEVIGAKTHNLKNVSVKIPKNKMTVITGVSGSWKSSLAFNTIYNVGQQKYLESLSSYARMFIGGMKEEAEVSEIIGLSPTISIDQKTTSKNPRSTVGTITEIFDYYKLLFLNVGIRKCIDCGTVVKKDSISDIIETLWKCTQNDKFIIKAPLKDDFEDFEAIKKEVLDLWFIRFSINGEIITINDEKEITDIKDIFIVIDRLVIKDYSDKDSADTKRLKDSIELAYKIGKGLLQIEVIAEKKNESYDFSRIFVCSDCGHIPAELTISSFSFNSHAGACQECHGLWVKKVFLEEKIINQRLTLLEWAVIAPGFGGDYFFALIEEVGKKNKINLNTNYKLLSKREKDIVLHGTWDKKYNVTFTNEQGVKNTYNSRFEWVIETLTRRYYDGWADKWNYDDFIMDMDCNLCDGHRLNQETLNVFLGDINIWILADMSVTESINFLKTITLNESQKKIAQKILTNATERLEFLAGVGLNYMTISRKAWTLSWWEAQRIRLATQLWTRLEGIIYVLDEPSIGLHPRDNDMLINNLKKLRDIWNTLIVVEHDEDIMRESDYIIDIGPWAWVHGWEICATGTMKEIMWDKNSVTWPYLNGNRNVMIKRGFRPSYSDLKKNNKILQILWAKQNNLQDIDVSIPLSNFVVVTGVSWSWKSSLVNDILANHLANELNRAKRNVGLHREILGLEHLDKTVIIDQSPIGKTPRSNPATYTGVFTPIRDVFALNQEAQIRGYGPGRFSFNTKQGRCEACDGDGVKKIEMHFLPPVYVECESCSGKRYNSETLQIKYKGKTISDVLEMTIEEASEFFTSHPKIKRTLDVLMQVGLWYIKLWQSSTTLSGWESQRVKLSTELSKRSTSKTFYILDEPTTGLHFQDVDRLLMILHSLVDKWNTVLVIEHNMDVIMNADHIIDIGPSGWNAWGKLMCEWNIEDIENCSESFTGQAILKYKHKSC